MLVASGSIRLTLTIAGPGSVVEIETKHKIKSKVYTITVCVSLQSLSLQSLNPLQGAGVRILHLILFLFINRRYEAVQTWL